MTLAALENGFGGRLSPGFLRRTAENDFRLVQQVDRPKVRRLKAS